MPRSYHYDLDLTKTTQFENSLRRHNHVGLAHALLVALAQAGRLSEAQEGARKAMQDRIEKRKAKGMDIEGD